MATRTCACCALSNVAARYVPLRKHPSLFEHKVQPEWIDPSFRKLIDKLDNTSSTSTSTTDDINHILSLGKELGALREEVRDVYSFPCFTEEFARQFNEECENFFATGLPVRRPNSMNNYGLIVNEIGMRPMITALQREYIWPLARRLFPDQGLQFDAHHSFIVRYTQGEDLGLDMHTDDSEVTFNACLGHGFTGATLTFCGDIGTPDHRHVTHVYAHEIGRAVMHLGSRRHGADDIASGTRVNLIVWSQNERWRRDHPNRRPNKEYEREDGKPDLHCLSFTHDRDYLAYKTPPEGKEANPRAWCPPPGAEYNEFKESLNHSEYWH